MLERKIIIGLITSTEYCQKVKDIWNIQLIESTSAKRLAGWCWEYFDKYKKAPGREIETIYYSKLKDSKLPKDIAEEIEQDILPSLSKEYENEDFNLAYLLDETEKYFSERNLTTLKENIEALVTIGQTEEAEKLIKEFKSLDTISNTFDNFVLTVKQIRKKHTPQPVVLMKPWLKEGQVTILYGQYGSGKSLLSLSIAYILGTENYEDSECEIGEWQVKHPTGCLYIDGELGEQEMEERVKQFEWIGHQSPEHSLKILSIPEYQLETEDSFYLSNRENQQKIIKWLKDHPTYKLIVLDSVSTLFGLEEENNNSEWNNKVSPLLRDLRALGVACLLLHHAGKDSKRGLRGATAMGAMAHNIFRLVNHEGKAIEDGEAWFTVLKDKQRASGFSFRTFSLKYTQTDNEKETHFEVTENN
jgi:hypothetical protein